MRRGSNRSGIRPANLADETGQTWQPPFDGWVTGAPYECLPMGTGGGALVGLLPQPWFGCFAASTVTNSVIEPWRRGISALTSLAVSAGPRSVDCVGESNAPTPGEGPLARPGAVLGALPRAIASGLTAATPTAATVTVTATVAVSLC